MNCVSGYAERKPGWRRPSVGATTVPWRPLPDESRALIPSDSSKRYHTTLPPPTVPPADVLSERTSSFVNARSKIWNSSSCALRYETLRCGNWQRPSQLPDVGPRSAGESVMVGFVATGSPSMYRVAVDPARVM